MLKSAQLVVSYLCLHAAWSKLGVKDCQDNTYLCDGGNHEMCNANDEECQCMEGYFQIIGTCAKMGTPGNLCREGEMSASGECECNYGYTRGTSNECGICRKHDDCTTELGVDSELVGHCYMDDEGYQGKCYKKCTWSNECKKIGQQCLAVSPNQSNIRVCRCDDDYVGDKDGNCVPRYYRM